MPGPNGSDHMDDAALSKDEMRVRALALADAAKEERATMEKPPADSPGPMSPELAALAAQLGTITGPIKTVVDAMIRGVVIQHRNVPPHVVLNAIAWQTGNLLGMVLQGDLRTMFQIRRGMNEAFADGVKKAPLVNPAAEAAKATLHKG